LSPTLPFVRSWRGLRRLTGTTHLERFVTAGPLLIALDAIAQSLARTLEQLAAEGVLLPGQSLFGRQEVDVGGLLVPGLLFRQRQPREYPWVIAQLLARLFELRLGIAVASGFLQQDEPEIEPIPSAHPLCVSQLLEQITRWLAVTCEQMRVCLRGAEGGRVRSTAGQSFGFGEATRRSPTVIPTHLQDPLLDRDPCVRCQVSDPAVRSQTLQ